MSYMPGVLIVAVTVYLSRAHGFIPVLVMGSMLLTFLVASVVSCFVVFVLCHMCPMSMHWPFLITPSFSLTYKFTNSNNSCLATGLLRPPLTNCSSLNATVSLFWMQDVLLRASCLLIPHSQLAIILQVVLLHSSCLSIPHSQLAIILQVVSISLVPKRIQIKLVRVSSSAHSFNLMRFAALVIIFSISTPCNYPIVVWSCD
jgi:hypothetical protein